MSVMTSSSWPRSRLMLSGTLTPATRRRASMNVSVAVRPMGSSRISQGTWHWTSRALAAAEEAMGPRARVARLSPVARSSATVVPPSGYIWNVPVMGPLSTLEVSGNRMVLTPSAWVSRLISSMSDGST